MGYKVNEVFVVDIEATCWEDKNPKNQSEIIEIGYAMVNIPNIEITMYGTILIEPKESEVSDFCTNLTTLTADLLKSEGISFEAALGELNGFNLKNKIWASWGDYDRLMFESQCLRRGVPYPFGRRHINLKTIFSMLKGFKEEQSVAKALKFYDIPFEGTPHRGGDDARMIANILCELVS